MTVLITLAVTGADSGPYKVSNLVGFCTDHADCNLME